MEIAENHFRNMWCREVQDYGTSRTTHRQKASLQFSSLMSLAVHLTFLPSTYHSPLIQRNAIPHLIRKTLGYEVNTSPSIHLQVLQYSGHGSKTFKFIPCRLKHFVAHEKLKVNSFTSNNRTCMTLKDALALYKLILINCQLKGIRLQN